MQAPMYLISLEFIEHAYRYIEKGVLSNGLYATLLASEMCERVTLYGFLRDWRGETRYHYYNQVYAATGGWGSTSLSWSYPFHICMCLGVSADLFGASCGHINGLRWR